MTPGSNHQEIAEAGEKALLHIYKGKSNEKTLKDVRVRAFTMRVASVIAFVQGRAASANFGCRKVPLLQVLFANNEVARHVRFAKARRVGVGMPLFVTEYVSSHNDGCFTSTGEPAEDGAVPVHQRVRVALRCNAAVGTVCPAALPAGSVKGRYVLTLQQTG